MNSVLIVGIVLSIGFLLGELVTFLKLPKVSGYIAAGIALNPTLVPFLPKDFVGHTDLAVNISLSIIAFSVGGALSVSKLKEVGRSVLIITFFEAQTALIITALGTGLLMWLVPELGFTQKTGVIIPFSLLLGTLACPTDPSATLAIKHEFNARGKVSSTILSVAGLDDVMGLLNFTFATAVALALISHSSVSIGRSFFEVGYAIGGSLVTGTAFAFILMMENRLFHKENEGAHIVMIISLLAACFGSSFLLTFDPLLSCMVMGAALANFSNFSKVAFELLERYTDELVFVLFFTLSAMKLDFSLLGSVMFLILAFVLFRSLGKLTGTVAGGKLSGYSVKDSLQIGLGFIPQGGIVVGLALTSGHTAEFSDFGDVLIAVVIGATIIHEIVGPILSMLGIRSAGELN